MRYVIINNRNYVLQNYFTETGRLHLFIDNTENYNLATLEDDILQGEVILIIENEDVMGEFVKYNQLKSIEKKFDENPQIYLYVDAENVTSILTGLQNSYETFNNRLQESQFEIVQANNALNSLTPAVDNLAISNVELQQKMEALEQKVQSLENNIDLAFEQINKILDPKEE